jgi:FkbM family methyltransferase
MRIIPPSQSRRPTRGTYRPRPTNVPEGSTVIIVTPTTAVIFIASILSLGVAGSSFFFYASHERPSWVQMREYISFAPISGDVAPTAPNIPAVSQANKHTNTNTAVLTKKTPKLKHSQLGQVLPVVGVPEEKAQLRFSNVSMKKPEETMPKEAKIVPQEGGCTREQLEIINRQLSPGICWLSKKHPWSSKCSFAVATKCPGRGWLTEYYSRPDYTLKDPFLAIFVGCNKAISAVNALRMGSRNSMYDVDRWREAFTKGNDAAIFARASCEQMTKAQCPLSGQDSHSASVHCIEPFPLTFKELDRAKSELGWGDDFVLKHAAFSAESDLLRVPTLGVVGLETKGIKHYHGDCDKLSDTDPGCTEISVLTLDEYMATATTTSPTAPIHYLSIDTEGDDFDVLLGGIRTLERVSYLEFEYSWQGAWETQRLQEALKLLKTKGLVCYWAGESDDLWRVTDCWLDHYDIHVTANLACVNGNIVEVKPLAKRMEEIFLATLKKDSLNFQ